MIRTVRIASWIAIVVLLIVAAFDAAHRVMIHKWPSTLLSAGDTPASKEVDNSPSCVCPLTDATPTFSHTFSLGQVPANSIQTAIITVQNLRAHPFVVQAIRRTCSCTQVQQDFKVLAAGATGRFRITMATASDEVPYAPHVKIAYDDGVGGAGGEIAIVLSMNAVKALTVTQETLLLGSIRADGAECRSFNVYRGKMGIDFTRITASCSIPAFSSEVESIDANTWRVTIQQRSPPPIGALDGIVSLHAVSASPIKDYGSLNIPVVGIATGDWSISSSVFILGSLPLGTSTSAEYLVRLPTNLDVHTEPTVVVIDHPKDLVVAPSIARHDNTSCTLTVRMTPLTSRNYHEPVTLHIVAGSSEAQLSIAVRGEVR